MNNVRRGKIIPAKKSHKSKAGYTFYEEDIHWQLDKNTKVEVGAVQKLLDDDVKAEYSNALMFYAVNLSPKHTDNINERFLHFLRITGASKVNESVLINYRASLTSNTEWYLGTIRGFLKKWHELGYEGVSEDVIELLKSWRLKGNIKGDVVKRLDPLKGPLSDLELQGFNEGIVQAYEKSKLSITDLVLGLATSNTGRRPIQISQLKIKDLVFGMNKKGEQCYFVNIPRAKQRSATFREFFKQFAITYELWVMLNAQASVVEKNVRQLLSFELQEIDRNELPLFAAASDTA